MNTQKLMRGVRIMKNLLLLKCAAIFGFIFLFATTNGSPAQAGSYIKCKYASGPSACHRYKRVAYRKAARGCPRPGPLTQISKRQVKCKVSVLNGKRIYCCRCIVRMCRRYFKEPIYKKPFIKKPPVLQRQNHRLNKHKKWTEIQSMHQSVHKPGR